MAFVDLSCSGFFVDFCTGFSLVLSLAGAAVDLVVASMGTRVIAARDGA
jgi:hypothetical protein